jgi:Ca-activated chloride channel homolog
MKPRLIISIPCLTAVLLLSPHTNPQTTPTYNLKVSVDEVELTFHAADARGLPVNDLRLEELRILDNSRAPRRIVLFQSFRDLPIRAGILIDTSSSMEPSRARDQAIAIAYAQRILDQKTDQTFIMSFGRRSQMRQTWSNNPVALTTAIRQSGIFPSTTAIFDTIYAACREQFGQLSHASTGNFILLFSDGEDDASFLSLQDSVSMCQQTNTAIYVFRADSPTGSQTLFQLASLTGGQVFRDSASSPQIDENLHIIQANLRNQYRLVYNPAELKRDGTFHSVVLLPPDRVAAINARSGYYSPKH